MSTLIAAFTEELIKIAVEVPTKDPLEDFLRSAGKESAKIRDTGRLSAPSIGVYAGALDPAVRRMRRDLREAKSELRFRKRQARRDRLSSDPMVRRRAYAELSDIAQKKEQVRDAGKTLVGRGSDSKGGFKKKPILTQSGEKSLQRLKHRALGGTILAAGAYGGYKHLQNKRNQQLPPGY